MLPKVSSVKVATRAGVNGINRIGLVEQQAFRALLSNPWKQQLELTVDVFCSQGQPFISGSLKWNNASACSLSLVNAICLRRNAACLPLSQLTVLAPNIHQEFTYDTELQESEPARDACPMVRLRP